MTETEATADVFLTALKALPKKERDEVLLRIARDRTLSRDLVDLHVFEHRRSEPAHPFRDYLADKKKK